MREDLGKCKEKKHELHFVFTLVMLLLRVIEFSFQDFRLYLNISF